jgi:hypothetical protein
VAVNVPRREGDMRVTVVKLIDLLLVALHLVP